MAVFATYWQFAAFDAPITATATTYRLANVSAPGTSFVFSGTGFTYDANGVPTGGVITSVSLIIDEDEFGPAIELTTITDIHIGLGDFGARIASDLALRNQLNWTNVLNWADVFGDPTPVSSSATLIRLLNDDGTFTHIVGAGMDITVPGSALGTVSAITHIAADGTTVLATVAVSVALQQAISAIVPAAAGEDLFLLLSTGDNTVTAVDDGVLVNFANQYFTFLEHGPGDDTIIGLATPSGGYLGSNVTYEFATSGVVVNLATGVASGGGGADTLTDVHQVNGSMFADTLIGDDQANLLFGIAGDDALSGGLGDDFLLGSHGNDVVDGGDGIDTAMYADANTGVVVSLAVVGAQNTIGAGIDTLIGIERLDGSNFNDRLTGDGAANGITGGDGDDELAGGAGDDVLVGGNGIDTASYAADAGAVTVSLAILGPQNTFGSGTDTLIGIENLIGSAFADTLTGDLNNNTLTGGLGGDTLNGGGGSDTVSYLASAGAVTINLQTSSASGGDAQGDVLVSIENVIATAFADTLTGDTNANVLEGGPGADVLIGGGGADTASYANALAGVTARLASPATNTGAAAGDTYTSIENLRGSNFADVLSGDAGANELSGLAGNDFLQGGDGADILSGGAGADLLAGGAGVDTADYTLSGAATVDLAAGTGASNGAVDTLTSIEIVTGSFFNDTLMGRDFVTDTLNGGGGDDVLMGRYGGDVLNGGAGIDTIAYTNSLTGVDVRLFSGLAIGGEANGDTYSSIENIIGTATRTDTLAGDANANSIWGGGGNESITGREGSDTLFGEAGNDTLLGGADDDFLIGGAGADTLGGGAGIDTADYSASGAGVTVNLATGLGSGGDAQGDGLVAIENVIGSAFNDVIIGKANVWDNVFDGGAGDDTITGGLGNDTFDFWFGQGSDTITDFSPSAVNNNDVVFLFDFGPAFNSFAEVIAAASQVGADTVIDFGAQTLTLQNVTLGSLTADNFFFG